jgi:hypothetical protein
MFMKRESKTGKANHINVISLFEAMPGCSLLIQNDAPHFTIAAATEDFCNAFEKRKEQLIGNNYLDFFAEKDNDDESPLHFFQQVITTKEKQQY